LNVAFQSALATALDPHLRAADAKTHSPERTLAMYREYQNVSQPEPPARRRNDRSAVLAALLLLLAIVVSAGAIGLVYQEAFVPVAAAPGATPVDVHATVDFLLTANAPEPGTDEPPGAKETEIFAAVMQTVQSGGWITAPPPTETSTLVEASATPTLAGSVVLPTSTQTVTPSRTMTPSRTVTPTRTVTPSRTVTSLIATNTAAVTGVTSSTSAPTSTATLPSNTPAAPTMTSVPPTGTTAPPTSTFPPPTSTSPSLSCDWHDGSPNVSGDTVSVRVYNDGDLPVVVTAVTITWTGNDHLQRINWRFDSPFWSGNDDGPTVSAGTNKAVPVGAYRTVEFEFWGSSFSGSASVSIEADC
jgi:hypothetical protein